MIKIRATHIIALSCLAFAACHQSSSERVARLESIRTELEKMQPDEVNNLIVKATGGKNPTEAQMKSIVITLPSGIKPTIEEVRNALILSSIGSDNPNAGKWEDDPKNWYRAFGEQPPESVSMIHSYYWQSNHFTREYIYFFVVKASPEWKDAFLKKRGSKPVAPSDAWSYRSVRGDDDIPQWFAPGPVEQYEVWDLPGYHGSIFINRATAEIYFEGAQL